MEWRQYAKEIRDLLNLKGSPIAVTFSMKAPASSSGKKHRVCDVFLKVRDGEIADLTAETSVCRGGSVYLGLTEPQQGEEEDALKEFLVDGEKLCCSIVAFHRMRSLSPKPPARNS